MKILSLDTAMAACSVAVIDTGSALPLAAAFVPMERGHAEALPPMVAGVMTEAGLDFSQIDRIAVTTGPGTFTGVRIGLAFARGLGLARGIPVIGIDSLSAVAANETQRAPLLVAADARNDEVYSATFDPDGNQMTAPKISTVRTAATSLPEGGLVLGTASRAVIAASGRMDLFLSDAGDVPVAAHFARMAECLPSGPMPSPVYLRAPDAKPQSAPLRKIGVLTIESVGPPAAALLSELHDEIFRESWTVDAFAGLLGTPGAEAVIASEQGEPRGFLVTRTAADEAEVITIGCRPSVQRRGVARQMLDRQVKALSMKGVRNLFLEVAASNVPAQRLYTACGFVEAGRRKGYYKRRDGVEDAIVMRRELHP